MCNKKKEKRKKKLESKISITREQLQRDQVAEALWLFLHFAINEWDALGEKEKTRNNIMKNTIITNLMMETKQKNQQSNDFWPQQGEREVQIVVVTSAITAPDPSVRSRPFPLVARTQQFFFCFEKSFQASDVRRKSIKATSSIEHRTTSAKKKLRMLVRREMLEREHFVHSHV